MLFIGIGIWILEVIKNVVVNKEVLGILVWGFVRWLILCREY